MLAIALLSLSRMSLAADSGKDGNSQKDGVVQSRGAKNTNVIAIDVRSKDKGETLRGTMTYSKEGPIGFLGKLRLENGGDNYTVQNEFGGAWHPADGWVIGCRDKQHVVALKVNSKDNGKTLNGSITYAGEGPIQIRAKRGHGVVYDVENEYAGGTHNDGAWVLGSRGDARQYLVAINIVSKDEGKTFDGKITYKDEGPIGFRARQLANDGNGYRAEVEFGGSWHPGGDWIIGGRNQRTVKLSAKSTDGGKTLSGTVTHRGEGPIGFKARISDGHAYTVENQWAGDSWKEGGVFVLGSRSAKSNKPKAR